jgi:hypothetical protein
VLMPNDAGGGPRPRGVCWDLMVDTFSREPVRLEGREDVADDWPDIQPEEEGFEVSAGEGARRDVREG